MIADSVVVELVADSLSLVFVVAQFAVAEGLLLTGKQMTGLTGCPPWSSA